MWNLWGEKVLPNTGWTQFLDSVSRSKERGNMDQKVRYLDSLAQGNVEIKICYSIFV